MNRKRADAAKTGSTVVQVLKSIYSRVAADYNKELKIQDLIRLVSGRKLKAIAISHVLLTGG